MLDQLPFALGLYTLGGAITFAVLCALSFQARRFGDYMRGTTSPVRPFKAWMILSLIFGLFVGSLVQKAANGWDECKAQGGKNAACLIQPGAKR